MTVTPKPEAYISRAVQLEMLAALRAAVDSVPAPTGIGIGLTGLEFRYPSWFAPARAAIRAAERDLAQ